MSGVGWVFRLGNLAEAVDSLVKAVGGRFHFCQSALVVWKGVDKLCELDLDKGDVELEVDLFGGDFEGALGVVKGRFHGGRGLVVFAFEKPNAAEAGKNLRVVSSIFGKSGFILVESVIWEPPVVNVNETYTLDSSRVLLKLAVNMAQIDRHACITNGILHL